MIVLIAQARKKSRKWHEKKAFSENKQTRKKCQNIGVGNKNKNLNRKKNVTETNKNPVFEKTVMN